MFILINLFEVPAARQLPLCGLLEEFTKDVTQHLPGFVSATVHRGLDDRHIANYVRWRTREDFDAMFRDPRSKIHMQLVQSLATSVSPVFYEITYHCGESV